MKLYAERYHDICAGHRVYGHESKCSNLHGHNYRIHFKCEGRKDELGRVVDFSVIKKKLCMWLEDHWDHKMLLWENDPICLSLHKIDPDGVVIVPFNPTAENMCDYLLNVVGAFQMMNEACTLVEVRIEETAKCSAVAKL